ncbi:MAG TPA: leucyl aminopeptidase [Desulfobacterales bacterium]|jgi:leucyl aminopeptidase|nr:leucyl aminopeptidase [Desulfobacterales bacterium]
MELKSLNLKTAAVETLVVPVCEDAELHANPLLGALAAAARALPEFSGKTGEAVTLFAPEGVQVRRAVFIGLGPLAAIDREALRRFAGAAVQRCIGCRLAEVLIAVPAAVRLKITVRDLLTALLEGAFLANHRFDRYKAEKKDTPLDRLAFLVPSRVARQHRDLPGRVATVCGGTLLAREWVSTPANDKRPAQFVRDLIERARAENLDVTVLDERALQQEKLGALLAVGGGSDSKPALVLIAYSPRGARRSLALVGKGVTFDAGGLNLKPTGSIEEMKVDMAGAAAVAATMIVLARLKPKLRVVAALPVVENMISGSAYRPGDVVTSYAGKTIEIGNTDAEGRLILVDAMAYVIQKYRPDTLIDLATLTGACVVALGEGIAGVFSRDDDLAEAIVRAGRATHERCWKMPLPDDYKELLKSDIADLRSVGSTRWGGAIAAALFLSEFVGDTRWAHIDIAGPVYRKKEDAYCGAGGTGFGVRLLWELIEKL